MTLYTLITNIQNLAKMEPNIGFITQGDIYSLNHIQDVVYPAFVITQAQHTGSYYNEYENYSITMFLVDRLVEDKSNELDVQSWANTCIQNILHRIEETNLGIVGDVFTVQTFTEKFDSLCAGAYATINIRVPILQCECGCSCGGNTPEPTPTPGDITEQKVREISTEIATEIIDDKLIHYVDNETFSELENTVDDKQEKLKFYAEDHSNYAASIGIVYNRNTAEIGADTQGVILKNRRSDGKKSQLTVEGTEVAVTTGKFTYNDEEVATKEYVKNMINELYDVTITKKLDELWQTIWSLHQN